MKRLKTKIKKPKKEGGQLEFNFRENIIERYRKARELIIEEEKNKKYSVTY